jgi:hypothetical protein
LLRRPGVALLDGGEEPAHVMIRISPNDRSGFQPDVP